MFSSQNLNFGIHKYMKIDLQEDNPFGPIPKGLVLELVENYRPSTHLDYGANDGKLIVAISKISTSEEIVGVELNADVVEQNRDSMPNHVELVSIEKNPKLVFHDDYFDTVSIVGVLEHIYDQSTILKELNRVLKPEGRLIVAVPGKHIFSFLDMGNWKFVFPRAHRLVFSYFNSKEEYHRRYIECRNGMFGDIEVEKMWHQHFSRKEINTLLMAHDFAVEYSDGLGFFQRILMNIQYFVPSSVKKILQYLIDWDSTQFESTELVVVARKA
jgi:ubiquinone/menaquinone biosynthesis C-methylase UbiE